MNLWWAHLRKASPRYAIWHTILGSESVPLKSPASFRTDFGYAEAERGIECYELDWNGMNAGQRHRLAEWVASRFETAVGDALLELDAHGFAIRAEDVTVAFSLRAFI